MKYNKQAKVLALLLYGVVLFSIFLWQAFPALLPPKGLTETKIPSLSVSGLMEANGLFTRYEKEAVGNPAEPDASRFSYGQASPFQ